jgi:hypothetical protein
VSNSKIPKPKALVAAIGSGVADSTKGQNSTSNSAYSSKRTKHVSAHTSKSLSGMGDYYGSGVKAKIGRIRDGYSPGYTPVTKSKLHKPPKSVV